jgi:hypothetical protein
MLIFSAMLEKNLFDVFRIFNANSNLYQRSISIIGVSWGMRSAVVQRKRKKALMSSYGILAEGLDEYESRTQVTHSVAAQQLCR